MKRYQRSESEGGTGERRRASKKKLGILDVIEAILEKLDMTASEGWRYLRKTTNREKTIHKRYSSILPPVTPRAAGMTAGLRMMA
jgi:hypothetical protein